MDYSKSNLGGIRNRHVAPDDPPSARRATRNLGGRTQLEIAGAETPSIFELDEAIRDVAKAEAALKKAKERHTAALGEVQHQLMEAGLTRYVYTDAGFEYVATISAKEQTKVAKKKARTREDVAHDTNDGTTPDRSAK